MGAKSTITQLDIDGQNYPLRIYRERRRSVRVSLGKQYINLRIPTQMSATQLEQQLDWCRAWVRKQAQKNIHLLERYQGKNYESGDILEVGERRYQLEISYGSQSMHRAQLQNGVISLRLSENDSDEHRQKSIKHLLSRVVAKDFLPDISRRVHELNQLYFQRPIQNIRLKYNHSNWGSCSTKGNVNLSTRLLFAPERVIDYVIIHELAHLIEMNHSPRFWNIVAQAMPDYKAQEQWLKVNGGRCDF